MLALPLTDYSYSLRRLKARFGYLITWSLATWDLDFAYVIKRLIRYY